MGFAHFNRHRPTERRRKYPSNSWQRFEFSSWHYRVHNRFLSFLGLMAAKIHLCGLLQKPPKWLVRSGGAAEKGVSGERGQFADAASYWRPNPQRPQTELIDALGIFTMRAERRIFMPNCTRSRKFGRSIIHSARATLVWHCLDSSESEFYGNLKYFRSRGKGSGGSGVIPFHFR